MLRYMEFTVLPENMRDLNRLNCCFNGADLDRLARVSSLYGPGTVSCWLCTVVSVFVSWTLNKRTRAEDTITNDLIACLSFPIVAAGHLLHQIATFPGARSSILTTDDPGLIPWAAAIEASLTICEVSAPMALALFAVSTITMQKKRCYAVAATALIASGAESGLFMVSPRAPIVRSNLSRPFLLNRLPWMIGFMIVTFGYAIVSLVTWLRTSRATFERMRDHKGTGSGLELGRSISTTLAQQQVAHHHPSTPNAAMRVTVRPQQSWRKEECGLDLISGFAIFFVPVAFLVTFSVALGVWGTTVLGTLHSIAGRLLFFIPASTCQITDLDQAVALTGGLATLAFSCYDAFRARSIETH